ncbi:MAG: RagB/SusD family nutrient uptake outer membrane protein [Flavisolibacter sp.]|nr:RagB/SusD family nutrient uptake outer membrane protein [Flavisolibacter sp.]
MNSKYILSFAVAGSLIIAGCKKDFLETKPTQFVSAQQLVAASNQDPGLLNGNIAGLYTTMYTPGVGGTTRHDDFGQKGIDIFTDMIASDMVLGALNYGWYEPVARLQATVDFTRNEDYIPWRYYYRQIFGANTVIDALGGTDTQPTDETKRYTMGQAKAMRAYAYFYLSQLYAKEYGDGNAKILPIYTNTQVANQPKSTAKQVWDLMVSDLTQAITLLEGYTKISKDQVDQDVAKGLLAYVLGARGTQADWTQVTTLTQDIMNAYPVTDSTRAVFDGTNATTAGFNNVNTPSWMWGVDLTVAQDIDLVSWWGQVDYFTYSYAWAGDPKFIDRSLFNAIRADDVRKKQFVQVGTSGNNLQPRNKFFDPGRKAGGQRTVTTDLVYMRADEFYLLNAEANARIGQETKAKQALTKLLSQRITDLSYLNNLSGKALLDEIYLQTRIELWGEGKSYLAMKRNKATITRGPNHLFLAGEPIPYNDDRLTFVIPQAEVLNNPVLNQ